MNFHKRSKKTTWIFVCLAFSLYLFFMIYVLFISSYYNRTPGRVGFNIIPFKTIIQYIMNLKYYTIENVLTNLLGNIVVFIPLGFFIPSIFKTLRSGVQTTISVLIITFVVETSQRVLQVGSFDIDDIILNSIGGLIGYFIFYISFNKNEQQSK
ncbi:VanZ family protein [Alkaliphilus serpentinus]|uniref:VanZ family protein n=1 Tax=Alkaliphilus serpentinus TaxID=1482731 RepID=A0A833M946_9FIRM|nr:VanZ family protein [Alkaliphilus serpentinus]KAB3526767.1 VanZ family protein [Alkaliphilus serpentinus]